MSRKPVKWDDANPWHGHFLVMLDCRCAICGILADTADLYEHFQRTHRREYPDSLYRFCVKAGDRVTTLGWQMGEHHLPYCPECWAKQRPF
jgi:hypothetical protein